MSEHIEKKITEGLTDQQKAVSLFSYIKELNKLKQKAILNIAEYPWSRTVSSLPNDPENIAVFYRDRVAAEDAASSSSVLLSVHKPEYDPCPDPDDIFVDWLEPDWTSFRTKGLHINQRQIVKEKTIVETLFGVEETQEEEEIRYEVFADDQQRVDAYQAWFEKRNAWAERQWVIFHTRNLFADLYRLYFELQRDSETMELVVANGILCDRKNGKIKHPVLTKRVKLNYDPIKNVVSVEEIESSPELYSVVFQVMEDINLSSVNDLQKDLQTNDYHPLDRNDTPAFLKTLVHNLSSDSAFSEMGLPEKWYAGSRLLLYMDPCYIMRKRLDGTVKAIEQIIENVQETGYVPAPIRDIVSGGKIELPEDKGEETIEEQLAAVGGESADVLLSKEANKEQLEIAKRIENYNAVLVQGPPGTGKTHTIANLMGHFLAQGKSVLVTSQTPKALTVLKEKVAPGLQNLCVSVLEDSNADMERSIDGITDYMSRTTSSELKRDMERIAQERQKIIDDLADTRRKIFQIINQENNCIVYNGEEISPSKAAAFVLEHAEDLSYIPGDVFLNAPLPLTFEELGELYRSNTSLTAEDEDELSNDIPNPETLLHPAQFLCIWDALQADLKRLETLDEQFVWKFSFNHTGRTITFRKPRRSFRLSYPEKNQIEELKNCVQSFGQFEPWMKHAAVDGRRGGAFRNRWQLLMDQIDKTCDYAEDLLEEQFGQSISFVNGANLDALVSPLRTLKDLFAQKGKISKLALMLHKDCVPALEQILVNGQPVQSAKDCELALHNIELYAMRKQCALYWDELLSVHGIPAFFTLSAQSPELIAQNWIPVILTYLDWYRNTYTPLVALLARFRIPEDILFDIDPLDSDVVETEKKLSVVCNEIPIICDICSLVLAVEEKEKTIDDNLLLLQLRSRNQSAICKQAVSAIEAGNAEAYAGAYAAIAAMYNKYALQQHRNDLLLKLEPVAPQWAAAIRNREDIHGAAVLPDTIDEAWKWKQFSEIIDDLTTQPFGTLQNKSIQLSKAYRKTTAQYAEKCAWYHLLRRTEGDLDMRHALQGWKQTVKKIGKGTGKTAPALRAEARKLMSKCQDAVPAWIMPITRALESLDPRENQFDIVIIDEASQSDISSLAILYMGKKLIIVGDDKQVSPMAVGVEVGKMSALQEMFIKDKIPNAHLYDGKTSIYDVASTTFQPLMLREHFRCVPEIIGFSNMLSYDYKIKPLRDAGSSNLIPAVVNYRVTEGKRLDNKTNPNEAKAIVALMQACLEQPEYAGKTFGAISLLGDEQVSVLQRLIEENIDHKELIDRRILCGNASHFQGDERDVIFLSVVDSGTGKGVLGLIPDPGEARKKRYNVAASRARDQLWVVDSLDSAIDLQPQDIRKKLIDYSINPSSFELRHAEIVEKADSPFEVGVAQALVDRGYRLVQQWKVGAYRLDMVAVCGKKTVAIECDGERYHSGEAKVREDMERQTILERLGWRFIRIRGSEYFRNPEQAMERVVKELTDYEIFPEADQPVAERDDSNWELLKRVKVRAGQILAGIPEGAKPVDIDTIAEALRATAPVSDSTQKQEKSVPAKQQIAPSEKKSTTEKPKAGRPSEKKQKTPAEEAAAAPKKSEPEQLSFVDEKSVSVAPVLRSPVMVPTTSGKKTSETEKPITPQTTDQESSPAEISTTSSKTFASTAKKPTLRAHNEPCTHSDKQHSNIIPTQEASPKTASGSTSKPDVLALLNEAGVSYIDKRDKGGALWIIGGKELSDTVKKCQQLGMWFKFKAEGGKATKGKPGWWAK